MNKIPYKDLAAAEEAIKAKYPGADKYHAGLTFEGIFVEVWREGYAKIYIIE